MKIRFSLPFSSIFLAGSLVILLLEFLSIFNALRFAQCSPWVELSSPPVKVVRLSGIILNRLYVETSDQSGYCLKQSQWVKCGVPPYSLNPDNEAPWLINIFGTTIQSGTVLQVMRGDSFPAVTYYGLLDNGRLLSCSTDFDSEIEKMINSGSVLWLLLPFIPGVWIAVVLINMFLQYGSPTLWDFRGNGTKIK